MIVVFCGLIFFTQTQNRAAYYPPSQIAQLRPSPRWTAQGARPHRKPHLVVSGNWRLGVGVGACV
jgi:hypothetical protein